MIAHRALARSGCRKFQCAANPLHARSLATASSGESFPYKIGEAGGVKFASRELPGPTTRLAVVAKAGSRFEPAPGYSDGLEKFAFKNTLRRSSLRITRESELLGSELSAYHSRENLVLSARFLREDLPYFTELLGEIISQTKFTDHELLEEVEPALALSHQHYASHAPLFALDSAHRVAFHRGLGNPLYPQSPSSMKKYLQSEGLALYAQAAYAKPNFAVVASGVEHQEFSKWVGQFFADSAAKAPAEYHPQGTEPSKYYGGQERISFDHGNALVMAFPGSSAFTGGAWKPELAVLATLLGGQSTIKWSSGFSLLAKVDNYPSTRVHTTHHEYTDAGLLAVTVTGAAGKVASTSKKVVEVLKSVAAGNISSEDFKKAVATARFETLESGQVEQASIELTGAGLVQGGKAYQLEEVAKSFTTVTEDQLKKAAKGLLDAKASVSIVGDLYQLPYAEDLGLNV